MGKVDWTNLEIIETWSEVNSADSKQDAESILSELILKAFNRHKLAQSKRLKKHSPIPDQKSGE